MDMSVILSSAVVAAIISGIITLIKATHDSKVKHITEERKKWRDDIRAEIQKFCESEKTVREVESLYAFFSTRLNPGSDDDNKILETIKNLKSEPEIGKQTEELLRQVSRLLKNEWEKGKFEAHSSTYLFVSVFVTIALSITYFIYDEIIAIKNIPLQKNNIDSLVIPSLLIIICPPVLHSAISKVYLSAKSKNASIWEMIKNKRK